MKICDPNRKDARFAFHARSAVQSALADLLGILTIGCRNAWNDLCISQTRRDYCLLIYYFIYLLCLV